MFASTQELRPLQELRGTMENHSIDVPADLVPPFAEMIHPLLPDDFFGPAPDDLAPDHHFWSERAERFEANMTKGAILHAWREGETGSMEALHALLAYDVLDFELAMQLLSDHDKVAGMLVSPVEVS